MEEGRIRPGSSDSSLPPVTTAPNLKGKGIFMLPGVAALVILRQVDLWKPAYVLLKIWKLNEAHIQGNGTLYATY